MFFIDLDQYDVCVAWTDCAICIYIRCCSVVSDDYSDRYRLTGLDGVDRLKAQFIPFID